MELGIFVCFPYLCGLLITYVPIMANKLLNDLYDPYTGDELWSLYTARYGKTPLFDEPGQLREVFDIYVQWCRNHPIEVIDYVKSGMQAGREYTKKMKLLVTEFGFTQFLGVHGTFLTQRVKRYKEMHENFKDVESLKFIDEIDNIREWIRDDMDKSAMVGQFDPTYTSKLRGLREYRDVTSGGEKVEGSLKVEVLSAEAAGHINALKGIAKKRERKAKGTENLKDRKEDE